MKMIFMGRKSYGAEMLKWSIEQGLDVIAVCTEPISMDGQADAKKTLMILLLRLGLYHAAVSVSHMHRENIKRKRVVS